MTTTVDARNLACPQPVILTRKAMRDADDLLVLVSSAEPRSNVSRLAEKSGWQVQVEQEGSDYRLHLLKGAAGPAVAAAPEMVASSPRTMRTVVLMKSDRMGEGDPELGGVLVRAFFHTLTESEVQPDTLVFYNAGVRLVTLSSPILEDLRTLEEMGVEILACGTCLKYYDLMDQLGVGVVSNMYTIAETLLSADRLVTP